MSITNHVIDTVAAFFECEDDRVGGDYWKSEDFYKLIAQGAAYETIGLAAIGALMEWCTDLCEETGPEQDPRALVLVLSEIIEKWPAEWMAPLGEKLDGMLAQYARVEEGK